MIRLARLLVVASGLGLLLTGCGGGNSQDLSFYDNQIRDRYILLANALERQDLTDLATLVSTRYLQDGVDYEGFRATFAAFFNDYDEVRVDLHINAIDYDDNSNPTVARVNFDQVIAGFNLAKQVKETVDNETRSLIWRYEDGRWRMYGNQQTRAAVKRLPVEHRPAPLLGVVEAKRSRSPQGPSNPPKGTVN